MIDQKGFRKHLKGFLLNCSQNYFVWPRNFAQLRDTKRTSGVLNNFGETSHN